MQIDIRLILLIVCSIAIVVLTLDNIRRKRQQRQYIEPEMGDIEPDVYHEDEQTNEDAYVEYLATDPKDELNNHAAVLSDIEFNQLESSNFEPDTFKAKTQTHAPTASDDSLILINVFADVGNEFIGYELLHALLAAGLRHGELDIFHRFEVVEGKEYELFSLASATNPGTFDINNMGSFSCKGLTLFMTASDSINPLRAFELMLLTARQLRDDLNGRLLDDKRTELIEQAIIQYKHRIFAYCNEYS